MCEERQDGGPLSPSRDGRLKLFARWFEPYGILIAVCALIAAIGTLWVEIELRKATLVALAEERDLRNRTLVALAEEQVLREETLVALAADKLLREATLLSILLERFDVARKEKANYSGHVQILERISRIGMDLRNLDASLVDFSVDDGIDLTNTDLSEVDFSGSDLSEAKLADTKLNRANLREAELYRAHFSNADLTHTNFKDAKGLTQMMLDVACSSPDDPPVNLPRDSRTERRLVWKGRMCDE